MKIFRVSDIIAPYSSYDRVDALTLQLAAERGTDAHDYLNVYLMGVWAPMPEGAEGYCRSGERWLEENVKRVISAEREYTDPVLGYKGHPDLLMENYAGEIILPDFKSPVIEYRSWPIQLAAYHHLVCKTHKFKRAKVSPGALMLSPTGGPAKFKPYSDRVDRCFALFLGLLNSIRYFEEGK
jgi:hypothetical protein